jgi:hypothetical protein
VAKAGILNETVSLGVKLERGKWRKQNTRIKATGLKALGASDRWLGRRSEMKIRRLEHKCQMTCESKRF